MKDSSDEDDLEALRLEALKSLKSKRPSNQLESGPNYSSGNNKSSQGQTSSFQDQNKDTQHFARSSEEFSPSKHRNEHYESHRSAKSHDRNQDVNRTDSYSRSSRKNDHHSSSQFERSTNFKDSKSKQTTDSKFDSSHRFSENSSSRNNKPRSESERNHDRNWINRRRNAPFRRSRTPNRFRNSSSQRYRKGNSPRRKYSSKPGSAQNHRRPPHNKNYDMAKESSDPLSNLSLPLCSPKHYVELFYKKKLTDTNNATSFTLNDEDRAVLTEKSSLENDNVPHEKQHSINNEQVSAESQEKSEKPRSSTPEMVRRNRSSSPLGGAPRRVSPNNRFSSRKGFRDLERKDKRSSFSNSRRPNSQDAKRKKLDEKYEPFRSSLSSKTAQTDDFEKNLAKIAEPVDPVLEARRKKFENNDTVKVVSKKIKLVNQPSNVNTNSMDAEDLRNILIAKHREKSKSIVYNSEENVDYFEDQLNLYPSSPLDHPSLNNDFTPGVEENVTNLNNLFDFSQEIHDSSSMLNCDDDQFQIKLEVEADDFNLQINQSFNPVDDGCLNEDANDVPDPVQEGTCNEPVHNEPDDFVPKANCDAALNSSELICPFAIKEEPQFNEFEEPKLAEEPKEEEEKPFIDEPDLIPQRPDTPEDGPSSLAPFIKIKPLTELLDKKVLKKAKKSKKKKDKESRKHKKKSKMKDRENFLLKSTKHSSKHSSKNISWDQSYPTRIVRSAFEEVLGKKKRKVFESDIEISVSKTDLDDVLKKDRRKVLILSEPEPEKSVANVSPSSSISIELEPENSFEESTNKDDVVVNEDDDNDDDNLSYRLSAKAPLYNSKKSQKKSKFYGRIRLNQV